MRKPQKRHEFRSVPCKVFDLEVTSLCDVIPSRYARATALHPLQPGRYDGTGTCLDMEGEFPTFWGEDKFMMKMEIIQEEKSCKVEIISLWLHCAWDFFATKNCSENFLKSSILLTEKLKEYLFEVLVPICILCCLCFRKSAQKRQHEILLRFAPRYLLVARYLASAFSTSYQSYWGSLWPMWAAVMLRCWRRPAMMLRCCVFRRVGLGFLEWHNMFRELGPSFLRFSYSHEN